MANKNENKKSYVYQLAIDNIEENRSAEYSRIKIIDITPLYGKNGFNKLTEAVNFTGQFKNYSELYLKLLQLGLVAKDDLGKPFTFVHRIKNKTKIDAIGTKRFPYNNRVLFKDQLSMLSYPDK